MWADKAYSGEEIKKMIRSKKIKNRIHQKGSRINPLTQNQKNRNRKKSKFRSRVEHIFGHMHQAMGGFFIRTIGMDRAAAQIGLKNLAYNISRTTYLLNYQEIGLSICKI